MAELSFMSPLQIPTEQERRAYMLATGTFSDCRIQSQFGVFNLHKSFITARCEYLWCLLATRADDTTCKTMELSLPPALDTDGNWQKSDLDHLWRALYSVESQWEADWQTERDRLSQCTGLSLYELQRWLRLHRLADFVRFNSLVDQIERFLLGPGLQTLMQAVMRTPQDVSVVLVPFVQSVLHACAADEVGRFRLGQRIVAWLLTLGISMYDQPQQARAAWIAALQTIPSFAAYSRHTPCALLLQSETSVTVVCKCCETSRQISTDCKLDRIKLHTETAWSVLRMNVPGSCNGEDKVTVLAHHDISKTTQHQQSGIAFCHINVQESLTTFAPNLVMSPKDSSAETTVYLLPPATPEYSLLQSGLQGRCMQCHTRTAAVHVIGLLNTKSAIQKREKQVAA